MFRESEHNPARRALLRRLSAAFALSASAPLLLRTRDAQAQKTPKNAVQYQPDPKGDQQCSNCRFYQPPESGDGPGQCQVVAGEIPPEAWCQLWTAA